ncbi:MAG: DUF2326 domain-containing protein [Acholeplasmatales bacterium]|nr:DUF2326 domain-containing protein [Acholeplasmatales bacterium]
MDREIGRIKLIKLSSENHLFDDINFRDGLNIILGETSDVDSKTKKKTNAVGKSLAISFLNFALLADYKKSRIDKIPEQVFPLDENVILDFSIDDEFYQIRRNRKLPEKPVIIANGRSTKCEKIEEATAFIYSKLYKNNVLAPSFRELFNFLCRAEESEFKDIKMPFDTKKNIPINIKPLFYLMGFDLNLYDEMGIKISAVKTQGTIVEKIKKDLSSEYSSISSVKAEINSLKAEVQVLNESIEQIRVDETFKNLDKNIDELEKKISELRTNKMLLQNDLNKLEKNHRITLLDTEDILLVYNSIKKNLGDSVVKSIEQTNAFATKISEFQNVIIKDKVKELKAKLLELDSEYKNSLKKYDEYMSILNQKGVLKDVKVAIKNYDSKKNELSRKSSLYQKYEEENNNLVQLKSDCALAKAKMSASITNCKSIVENIEDTISDIHDYIIGNRECSLSVLLNEKSRANCPVDIKLRIYDDGSHSIDRLKVFIYDLSLMLNEKTNSRHPMVLIHDNIFDVDKDSLIKSLNYLYENCNSNVQYIMTLNYDKVNDEESIRELNFDINECKIVKLTKTDKFFKKTYSELD